MESIKRLVEDLVPPGNFSSIVTQPSFTQKINIVARESLVPGIPDGILSVMSPVIAYWIYASIFHIIDVYQLAEKYRIHPSEEELTRNKATMKDVIQDVIFQHIVQTIVGYAVYKLDPPPTTGYELYEMWMWRQKLPGFVSDSMLFYGYMYGWSLLRLIIAISIIDTWQFFLHRYMHLNKTLYRKFHSRHHRLYVPFAYGALYNDPVEGFLLDTLGTGVAAIVTKLSPREAAILYTFSTLKTVDDHCGYRLPFDIFQIIFPNNSLYHDIHHQNWGIKNNFSQPFFTIWDRWFNTQYEFVNEYKELQSHITLTKYKEFLANRTKNKTKESKKEQ